jgi:transposase-like protein
MLDLANFTLIDVMQLTPDECRDILIDARWPDGPVCPKCGHPDAYTINRKSKTKNRLSRLFKCRGCKRQFSATVGTIFEDSKIPLNKWFAAMYLMCASKKGISAHQLHRMLKISYESAWFMCHRVRAAMEAESFEKMTGTVEADETYVGPRTRRGHKTWHERIKDEEEMGLRPKRSRAPFDGKTPVFGMIERGGRARTEVVSDARAVTLRPILLNNLDIDQARLITDGHPAYRSMDRYLPHDVIDHEVEYVNGDVHTQNIENYWSIFKRGLYGVFHHVSHVHLPMYLNEFDFRANHRKVDDGQRFSALMGQTRGRLTWYCQTPQADNPFA